MGLNFKKIIVLLILGLYIPMPAIASVPGEQLKQSVEDILTVLGNHESGDEASLGETRRLLKQIVRQRFDYEKMSRLSLGRHWKKLTDQEKTEFVALFSMLLEETYLSKLDSYSGEKVVFLKDRVKKRKAQIDTKIVTDTIEIPINYRMFEKKPGEWKVYDLVIEGVSLVGNYRSQFGQMLDSKSFKVLLDKLREKIKQQP